MTYQWLEDEEEIPTSPMAKMRPPIVPDQPVPVIPDDGLRRLLAACAGKGFEARRDTAMTWSVGRLERRRLLGVVGRCRLLDVVGGRGPAGQQA